MKLLALSMSLQATGWKKTKRIIEVKETPTGYVFPGSRVHKSKLMVPETLLRQSHRLFLVDCYCLPKDEEICFKKIYSLIIEGFTKVKAEVSAVDKASDVYYDDIPVIVKEH